MVERPAWAPPTVDPTRPSIARVYDYYLGGAHNFQSDRAMAHDVLAVMPDMRRVAQENRAFLRRAVQSLCDSGIDQFLDLGSGIPTVGNVHEVARSIDPAARVVYVDVDPVAVVHSRHLLADDEQVVAIQADLRDPASVLADPVLRAHLDVDRPVAVLFLFVLHFVSDEPPPAGIVARYMDAFAPGSCLVISHASYGAGVRDAQRLYNTSTGPTHTWVRTYEEIRDLFAPVQLLDPGVVRIPLWRPESEQDVREGLCDYPGFAGVGRRA